METNIIIQELRARASLGWNPEQQAWFDQQANDARPVQCVRMRDAFTLTTAPVRYVEGFAYYDGLLSIEHAFVKVGDLYIDPTFERALHLDVRKEIYASCIELNPETMVRYQLETGFYGELYQYDYLCKNRPELAAKMRARNPHNR